MENSVQQEILLMTNSSLLKTNLCEKNSSESAKHFSNVKRSEEACWNGMLEEFLPGLVMHIEGSTLFLWEIQTAKSFLQFDLCDQVPSSHNQHSIDLYIFLNHFQFN